MKNQIEKIQVRQKGSLEAIDMAKHRRQLQAIEQNEIDGKNTMKYFTACLQVTLSFIPREWQKQVDPGVLQVNISWSQRIKK